jgi:hypothetical protein
VSGDPSIICSVCLSVGRPQFSYADIET